MKKYWKEDDQLGNLGDVSYTIHWLYKKEKEDNYFICFEEQ